MHDQAPQPDYLFVRSQTVERCLERILQISIAVVMQPRANRERLLNAVCSHGPALPAHLMETRAHSAPESFLLQYDTDHVLHVGLRRTGARLFESSLDGGQRATVAEPIQ